MKSTIYFEPINGYLVRMYDSEVDKDTRIKYHGVCVVEIDGKAAIIKGGAGKITHRNQDDIAAELKQMGVETATWERYDVDGNLKTSVTRTT
jgi:hypothetical protein